jgi:glycosyltransferase involved in cell wall biosynthesis
MPEQRKQPEQVTGAGQAAVRPGQEVVYVLKGYPRTSELFIASEIWRLEQRGVPLRLYVLKPSDESTHHEVVDKIVTTPVYLPPTTKLTGVALVPWLLRNAGPFLPALARCARRHPVRFARATAVAAAQSVRAHKGWKPRTIYVKELLQALWIADDLDSAGDARWLHAHFAHGTTTVSWLAAQLLNLPFSFTGHAKDIYRESLNPAGLLARKMRAAEFVVTCTNANVRHLRHIAPEADVQLAYHGLNVDFAGLLAAAPPRSATSEPPRVRVLSVGRLVSKKGFDVLIEATALLRQRGLDLEVLVAGEDGDESDRLRQLVAERGLADVVQISGPLTQQELLAQCRRATMFALACRVDADGDRDGIPNVLVEAMAARLAVISTRVSGIPELVEDGVNGLLVAPQDAEALADAVLTLAKDPELREQLAAAGEATVASRFNGDVLAARMAGLLGVGAP